MENENKDQENPENENQENESLKSEGQESSGVPASGEEFSESEPETVSETTSESAPESAPAPATEPVAESVSQADEDEEEFEKATVKEVSIKWGLYIGIVLIIWSLFIIFAGLIGNQALSYVAYLFLIAGIVMAHKEFKENGDGFMSYSQGLGIGTLLSLISGAISSIFSYIYVKFIDDSMLTIVKDLQIEKMEEQGLSDAEIDQAMSIAEKFMIPEVMFPMALFGMVFVGFILSLIVAAFTKNANPQAEI